jgi:acyl-CoA synthetase (NDP forming)
MSTPVGYIPNRTRLFGQDELHRLIAPKSVAVVGASETPGSFGARTLDNIRIGYGGKIYPINPRYQSIAGLKCYASLEELPEVPDCVIVIVPMTHVEPLVNRAAALGVGGMILYSAGFAEVGTPEQVMAQYRIAEVAEASGMRILGPNCVGIVNLTRMVGLTFMPKFAEMRRVKGTFGLVSQSGALGYCVLQAMERGIGFSHYLSPGNSCDVDVCDLISYLVDDEATTVIGCVVEGVRDGSRLMEACRRALVAGKPLLIYKLATSSISQRSTLSHTGTMAGSGEAYKAAFARSGVIEIDNLEEMLETAVLLTKAGPPSTAGIGVMASSGGAAVIAADKAEEFGVPLPPPAPETSARLGQFVPDFGSTANPCDITAESLRSVQMYADCIRVFADDPGFAAIVVPMMSAHKPATVERAQHLSALADQLSKPICVVWTSEWLDGPGSEIYDGSPRISMFRSATRCLKAIAAWLKYYRERDELLAASVEHPESAAAGTVREQLRGIAVRRTLSENESKRVLACYGVPVTGEVLACSVDAAIAAAVRVGFPVALKVDSADIPHKTEAGVIRLNVADEAGVRAAYADLVSIATALPGAPAINGILVQQMACKGMELMIGARNDPQFGPLILCGFGGIDVELTRDVAVALAPVTRDEALKMIQLLKRAPLLCGYRKLPPLDTAIFADAVSKVSALALDLKDEIDEIDVNPFILGTSDGVAVDALIIRRLPG